jgi:hypothetical protein
MITIKKTIPLLLLTLFFAADSFAFCGFYVAKADAKIFNKASQVIIARDGNKTVITMSNDFQGKVKNFAMVVPVPQVLQEQNIKVVDRNIFDKLDAYSSPRLVEYHDPAPCNIYNKRYKSLARPTMANAVRRELVDESSVEDKDLGVTIQAKYNVGEYDILILSATQSNGLKTWLTQNGYKIPRNAEEVLDPYIKSDMKFFVAKVNLSKFENQGFTNLRPLQITMNSPKFMLPIRLGMANGRGNQDLIIYTLTKKGRVECTNYRTIKMPTGMDMPTFIKDDFGNFYADVFKKRWQRNRGKAVYLEYSWDISPRNFVKCDPCVSPAPNFSDMQRAGAWWVEGSRNENVHFTRLHVRYNRKKFPQDLKFQTTPNKTNFQARYVLRHPYRGDVSCEKGQQYVNKVIDRREAELENLEFYTGQDAYNHNDYVREWERKLEKKRYRKGSTNPFGENTWGVLLFVLLNISVVISVVKLKKARASKK